MKRNEVECECKVENLQARMQRGHILRNLHPHTFSHSPGCVCFPENISAFFMKTTRKRRCVTTLLKHQQYFIFYALCFMFSFSFSVAFSDNFRKAQFLYYTIVYVQSGSGCVFLQCEDMQKHVERVEIICGFLSSSSLASARIRRAGVFRLAALFVQEKQF